MKKYGIEYQIFEYGGQGKKEILKFRSAPGNIKIGLNVMRQKLGIIEDGDIESLKSQVRQHTENIIRGKSTRR